MKKTGNWNDTIQFDHDTYEEQSFSQRVKHGLTVDRHHANSRSYLHMHSMPWNMLAEKPVPVFPIMQYRTRRRHDWNTKRWAYTRIADLANVHKQMLELLNPVLHDMLSDVQPTAVHWKKMSNKGEKQVRRTEKYYQHMVGRPGGRVMIKNRDGGIDIYPQRIVRKGSEDARVREITTPYSSPDVDGTFFDSRVFADKAYVKRQRIFWKAAVHTLSKWLKGGGRIRRNKEWLLYHIVNNDIASHVLFDNLSEECESHWLSTLDLKPLMEICNGSIGITDENEPVIQIGTVPEPFAQNDAEMAVTEHEKFVADFGKKVPDNLQRYMIPQPKMRKRIRDLIIESAVALKPFSGESDWAAAVRQCSSLRTGYCCIVPDWELVCAALTSSSLSKEPQ